MLAPPDVVHGRPSDPRKISHCVPSWQLFGAGWLLVVWLAATAHSQIAAASTLQTGYREVTDGAGIVAALSNPALDRIGVKRDVRFNGDEWPESPVVLSRSVVIEGLPGTGANGGLPAVFWGFSKDKVGPSGVRLMRSSFTVLVVVALGHCACQKGVLVRLALAAAHRADGVRTYTGSRPCAVYTTAGSSGQGPHPHPFSCPCRTFLYVPQQECGLQARVYYRPYTNKGGHMLHGHKPTSYA